MTAARFAGSGPLRGRLALPGDKSISHRALIFGALAEGRSRVRGLSTGDDVARTRAALEACGIRVEDEVVHGGRRRFTEPERPLDVGNSGTAMRLLAGVLATFDFLSVLVGDDSVHRRPMDRVSAPLREMGALVDGRQGGRLAPLVVRGGRLVGVDHAPAVPSAQVKGALLLAGLAAEGRTTVRERFATRPHTEELLELCGHPAAVRDEGDVHVVSVGPGELAPFELDVPGDPSQAAFLAVAASIVAGSEVLLENVYVGPGRAGFLAVLERMGASIDRRPRSATAADLLVRSAPLSATEIEAAEVPDCIDELPVLAVAAAFADGTTTVRGASELRVKESDRIETMARALRSFGVRVETFEDGMAVTGGSVRPRGRVDAAADHRVAMALAVAALAGSDPVEIDGFEAVATSWPSFVDDVGGLLCS
ncbi:MAG TPA: 3-phosphoshikimate 1-carboxyvinyltransferase [Acidimicrobiales bacterium]|nr:3-phosphoshikimate 1-carboxyvinyltransferase [Acidimicrobiales bacterium]